MDILNLPGFYAEAGLVLRKTDTESVPSAVFENSIPTSVQARTIMEKGFGLHVSSIPRSHLNLAFLAEFDHRLTHLSIIDFDCTDVGRILKLRGLEALSLTVNQQTEVDLRSLTALEEYDGDLRHFESVLDMPNVRRLELRDVRHGKLDMLPLSLETLMLVDAQSLTQLPAVRESKLRELYIDGIGALDLRSLETYAALETLGFSKARSIASVDALLALPRLRGLAFDRCPKIEPLESLLKLGDVTVSVLGRNPFRPEFRSSAATGAATWTYYGSANRA